MSIPLDGVIIVTGASAGIGEAFARQLAPTASALILVARRKARLEALAAELTAAQSGLIVDVMPCDLTDPGAARALVAEVVTRHGRVDVLVNNAGMGDIGPFETCDPDKLERMLGVNVMGFTAMARAVVPALVARKRGAILNVSSGFGMVTMPMFAAYAASKHYVTAFTEALRAELAHHHIAVTQLCPGPVATEFEAVAGNPFGTSVPSFVELTAEQCARTGLRGLRRNKAMVVPGFWAWLGISIGRLTPPPIYRLYMRLMGAAMRRQMKAG